MLKVLIVLGISLSGTLSAPSPPAGTSEARGAGSQTVTLALAADQPISDSTKDGKRKNPNRKAADQASSREDSKRNDSNRKKADIASASNDQKASEQDPPHEQNPPGNGQDRIDRKPGRGGNWKERCTGPGLEQLVESNLCTHGPDKPPPGFKVDKRVNPIAPQTDAGTGQAVTEVTAGITCEGDGDSGDRLEVLYVRGVSKSSRFSEYHSSIQTWTADMDQIFQNSSNGARRLRFVHDAGCNLIVREVTIPDKSLNSFNAMITELKNQGFNRTDRIYLSFVDTTSAGICGIATVWDDDRADGNMNYNNFGPSYARADAGCWNGFTAAHEVMHNLGGVQLSAPNTSGGYHCIDEYDVMCYSDSPNYPRMRKNCSNSDLNSTAFDCNDDDYYNAAPASGSYLANYWNAANNRFLISTAGTTEPPGPPESSVSLVLPEKVKRRTSLEVQATAEANSTSVTFGVCKGKSCIWESTRTLGTDTTSDPFSVSWQAPRRGKYTFLAQATDDAGDITLSLPKTVKVTRREVAVGGVTAAGTEGDDPATRDSGAHAAEQSDRSRTVPAAGTAEDQAESTSSSSQTPRRHDQDEGSERIRPEPSPADQQPSQHAQYQGKGKRDQETRKPSKTKQRTRSSPK